MTERLTDQEMIDLTMLLCNRCREQFRLVAQLAESDEQRAALLASAALDMMMGAVMLLEDATTTKRDAAALVVDRITTGLDDYLAMSARRAKAAKRHFPA